MPIMRQICRGQAREVGGRVAAAQSPAPHRPQEYHEQGQHEDDDASQVGVLVQLELVVRAVNELEGHFFLGRASDTSQTRDTHLGHGTHALDTGHRPRTRDTGFGHRTHASDMGHAPRKWDTCLEHEDMTQTWIHASDTKTYASDMGTHASGTLHMPQTQDTHLGHGTCLRHGHMPQTQRYMPRTQRHTPWTWDTCLGHGTHTSGMEKHAFGTCLQHEETHLGHGGTCLQHGETHLGHGGTHLGHGETCLRHGTHASDMKHTPQTRDTHLRHRTHALDM